MALLVHNQTTVVMSLCSLYHYHAEWPLKTDTWIKAGGCKPIGDMIRASLLLLHPKTSASCTGPLQWISRYLPRSTPRNEGRSAGTGSASRASFPGDRFFITVILWNVAPSAPLCRTRSLCPRLSCHRRSIVKSAKTPCLSLLQSYSY